MKCGKNKTKNKKCNIYIYVEGRKIGKKKGSELQTRSNNKQAQ